MSLKNHCNTRLKAASAALAFVCCPVALGGGPVSTIPPLPDEKEAFSKIGKSYHFRASETPLLIEDFINEFHASPLSTDANFMLGNWYFFKGEYSRALACYSRIPDNAFSGTTRQELAYRKAFSLVKTGFYDEAQVLFQDLVGSSTVGRDSQFYLAYIQYVKGNYDDAYSRFKKIKGSTRDKEADYYLNQIDYKNGEYSKVAPASDRLLSSAIPDELKAETLRVGGISYFKLGDKANARRLLEQYNAITGDGAEISALYSLASLYYDSGEYTKALPLFSTVTEYPGPLAQSAWLYIGQIHLNMGDVQAAALAFDKATRQSWDNDVTETAAYNLAVTSTSGMTLPFADGAAAMESFIETYPDSPYSPKLSNYLANAYYGKRDYGKALVQVDKISNPDASTRTMRQKILYQLGISTLQQGDPRGAVGYLRQASESGAPDSEVSAQASLWLGDAYYSLKDYKNAASAYEKALSLNIKEPDKSLTRYNLGYAYLKLHNYAKAEKAFQEAVASGPLTPSQSADARLRYADCLYYTGKYRQALALFRDIYKTDEQNAVYARIREADILGYEGNVAEKISILERLNADPATGIWQSTVLSRLADAYSEKGDDRKAAELYARILDSTSGTNDNSQTYFSLAANAENLLNAGDTEAAYLAYKRLENSGMASLYPVALRGVMLTSPDKEEVVQYAAKVSRLPGLSPEEINEATLLGAEAALKLNPYHPEALETLNTLAHSSDRLWGARAAVVLGESLLNSGNLSDAEEVLLYLIDNGSDDNYWLARGYIALADVYSRQDKDYLARLYLETLRNNYPGNEKDIKEKINSRLKSLDR